MRQRIICSFFVSSAACLILGGACGGSGKAKLTDAAVATPVVPKDALSDAKVCVLTNVNNGSTSTYGSGATFVINCTRYTCVNGIFSLSGLSCNTDAAIIPDASVAQNDAATKDAGIVSDSPVAMMPEAGRETPLARDAVLSEDVKIVIDVVTDGASAIADVVLSRDTVLISQTEVGIIQPKDTAPEVAILVPDAQIVAPPDAQFVAVDASIDVSILPDAPSCPGSLLLCSEACIDVRFNPAHCGSCGRTCALNEYCSAGVCESLPGDGIILCDGNYRDTKNDPRFCGGCSTSCRADEDCVAGVCGCANGLVDCGGACVNTQTSNTHCGTCGNACLAAQSCTAGTCQCPIARMLCGNACVDYLHDPANCGECGKTCAPGKTCVYDPNHPMSGISCQTVCGPGTTKCSDEQCHNLQAESANCGVCGKICRTDQACVSGSCECIGGLTDCGVCADTKNSTAHCGGCNKPCPNGTICSNSLCGIVCEGGTTKCNDNQCHDTKVDTANCGGCGKPCRGDQACVSGSCKCIGGLTDCGVCTDTKSSNSNCGSCGNACPAGSNCITSGTTTSCICADPTQTACTNGCKSLMTDPASCGACNSACNNNGTCSGGNCFGSYTICDATPGTYGCPSLIGARPKDPRMQASSVTGTELLDSLQVVFLTRAWLMVWFDYATSSITCYNQPYLEITAGTEMAYYPISCNSSGSEYLSVMVNSGMTPDRINLVVGGGDWQAAVRFTAATFISVPGY